MDRLIEKYDQALPRYTSYPTAPVWSDAVGPADYALVLQQRRSKPFSMYIHLPFCAERCTFCACNVVITTKRETIASYLKTLERELKLVAAYLGEGEKVDQLHLGGGTPNYLESDQMKWLMGEITQRFPFAEEAEISVEADPRWTDQEKIQTLRELGFNRISFGVQDLNPQVQHAINRVQPAEQIALQIEEARRAGFQSINIDLVYGLPYQRSDAWEETLEGVLHFDPDRIALFNFAFVPWMYAHHRKIDEASLPAGREKMCLFTHAIERFQDAGYVFIGLDHFAKEGDELVHAQESRSLHRNFQGYTTREGLDLIGLGVSAIGDIQGCYLQNARKLVDYQRAIDKGELATMRGWRLNHDDQMRRWVIGRLFCHQYLSKVEFEKMWQRGFNCTFPEACERLRGMKEDGLLEENDEGITITPRGRLFIRHVGAAFDRYIDRGQGRFSKAV